MRLLRSAALAAATVLAAAFTVQDPIQDALASIDAADLRAHLFFLSHDRLRGRGPGTAGGQAAALYVASQLSRAGVQAPAGGYFQPVRLTGVRTMEASLHFQLPEVRLRAQVPDDAVVWTASADTLVRIDAELVFVGYGTRAPEYDWDDFGDRDLRGKVLLVLVNEPPAPPEEPELFDGEAMTYYGRWTYKLEEAARRGAAGALLVHSDDAAGYDWSVVRSSWSGEQLFPASGEAARRLPLEGWVSRDLTRELLAGGEHSLEELLVRAARRDFRPIATGVRVQARVASAVRTLESSNVVGMVRGSDPELRGEAVVFTSHYDHLGVGEPVAGDSIYNGAYDNASGVALLLELAEAFGSMRPAPARSLIFLATTAEESGLLGAREYVRSPIVPLPRTAAVINVDGANLWGETEDLVALGAERSTLGRLVSGRAEELGLRLMPDPAPEKGLFFRSDQLPFARRGVPALYIQHGLTYRGRPEGWGATQLGRYHALRYHQPSDEFDPAFDLAGAVQQGRFAFLVGLDAASVKRLPEWLEDSGFPRRTRSRSP